MTKSATALSTKVDSSAAGRDIAQQLKSETGADRIDALIVFASSSHHYSELLTAIQQGCHPRVMVGCSSAGEFTSDGSAEKAVSAVALCSDTIRFKAALGQGLRNDLEGAARQLCDNFSDKNSHHYAFRSALVLSDALAGRADLLVEELTRLTSGTYQFFGGGAGDDGLFSNTHVFVGTEVYPDAVVGLEILSDKPVGIGVSHGWQPASPVLRVTQAEGMSLISLNAQPALEVFEEHAQQTGQKFDESNPLPYFLHNIVGIKNEGNHRLRVPLGLNADGSIAMATEVPAGAVVSIMSTGTESASLAAATAMQSALSQMQGHKPEVALFFDCVATRLRLGKQFNLELQALQEQLGDAKYAGFNTYGQIARAEGQFNGFHNCTAVVCLIPE